MNRVKEFVGLSKLSEEDIENLAIKRQELAKLDIGNEVSIFPKPNLSGKLDIINYDYILEKTNLITDYFANIPWQKPTTQDDVNNLRNISKGIKTFQKDLKEFLKNLDDEKIEIIRSKITDLIKLLAKRVGTSSEGIDYLIEEYKKEQLKIIIGNGYLNIKQQSDFCDDDFGSLEKEYEKKFLEEIKGKSSFAELQNISLIVSDNFSSKLENQQLRFDKYLMELQVFVNDIGYLAANDWLRSLAKGIVLNGIEIESQKEKINIAFENFKKEEQKTRDKETRDKETTIQKEELVEIKQENIILPMPESIDTDKLIFANIVLSLKTISKLKKEISKDFLNDLIIQIEEFIK
jgi:hypothetical protein